MNLQWNWIEKLTQLHTQNKKFALATIVKIKGSTPREIGAKMIVVNEKEFYGTIGGGALEAQVTKQMIQCLVGESKQAPHFRLEFDLKDLDMICGGDTEVFIEIINPNPDLYLFGAGHCGLALAHTFENLPFNLHVIDERQEWLDKYPATVKCHHKPYQNFIENDVLWNQRSSYVVIMTPGHSYDREILELMLNKPVFYLGMIGSLSKWGITKNGLLQNGYTQDQIDRVHCPIGLNIGGKTPGEIAISIASEIIQHRHQKNF